MKIPVGVSARHIHLKEETYQILFGNDNLEVLKQLKQPKEYASNSVLTIKVGEKEIKNVRVLGPFRDYNQVEISKTDAYFLNINPPVANSGNLENAESIILIGPKETMELDKVVIIANRHFHIPSDIALKHGIINKQKYLIKISGIKEGTIIAEAKFTDPGYLELHLDTDDSNAFLLNNTDEVDLEI